MKPTPFFLLGLTLLALGGPACAQTTPSPAPKTTLGKGFPPRKRAVAPPRIASMSAVKIDTAAFRHAGRPYDSILNRASDIPQSVPSKN